MEYLAYDNITKGHQVPFPVDADVCPPKTYGPEHSSGREFSPATNHGFPGGTQRRPPSNTNTEHISWTFQDAEYTSVRPTQTFEYCISTGTLTGHCCSPTLGLGSRPRLLKQPISSKTRDESQEVAGTEESLRVGLTHDAWTSNQRHPELLRSGVRVHGLIGQGGEVVRPAITVSCARRWWAGAYTPSVRLVRGTIPGVMTRNLSVRSMLRTLAGSM